MNNVNIADDVILSIAGVSAMKVKGVKALAGGVSDSVVTTISGKALKKGVKVEKTGDKLDISLNIVLNKGANVKSTSTQVQEKVKEYVENMLDLEVNTVNVNISGIDSKEE